MKKIFATGTKVKEQILVGRTHEMYKDGKTPEEIASVIKQSVERVLKCIEICKIADQKRSEMK